MTEVAKTLNLKQRDYRKRTSENSAKGKCFHASTFSDFRREI